MERNLYAPPAAAVADVAAPPAAVPGHVVKKIRGAWLAGCFSLGVTLLLTVIAIRGTSIAGVDAWNTVDVFLLAGLSWGIYRRNRYAAVGMLVYFVISKAIMFAEGNLRSGWLLSLVFLYLYVQGIRGTFEYHRLTRKALDA